MRERVTPYTALQREMQQFIAKIWHRRKTALFSFNPSAYALGQMDAAEKLGCSFVVTRSGEAITIHAVNKITVCDVPYSVRPDHIEGAL